jgi:hypothetical protein
MLRIEDVAAERAGAVSCILITREIVYRDE